MNALETGRPPARNRTALYAAILLAALLQGANAACAGPGCTWAAPSDPSGLNAFLDRWFRANAPAGTVVVGTSIQGNVTEITVEAGGTRGRILLTLDGSCDRDPVVESRGGLVEAARLRGLASEFPLDRMPLRDETGPAFPLLDGPPEMNTLQGLLASVVDALAGNAGAASRIPSLDRIAFLLLALGLAALQAAGISGPARARRDVVVSLGLAAMGLLAIVPVAVAPLSFGPEIERLVIAQQKPFSDWNHPSLQYLLSHAITKWTLAPALVRLVPALSALLLGFLVHRAARRAAGEPAAVLAAAWVFGSSRWHVGLASFGDWDLAGCFVLATALLLDPSDSSSRSHSGRRRTLLLICILLGTMSSWLALVPAAVAAALLFRGARRQRSDLAWALGAAGLVAGRGILALGVFLTGRDLESARVPLTLFLDDMAWSVLPGTTILGLVLIPAGILAWAHRRPSTGSTFLALSLVAVPPAVLAIWMFSAANGGYYIRLVSGPAAVAAACALGFLASRVRPASSRAVAVIFAAAATLATVDLPARDPRQGAANVPAFGRLIRADHLPVVTDLPALASVVHYHRASESDGDLGAAERAHDHALLDRWFDGERTWVHVPDSPGRIDWTMLPGDADFYLVLGDRTRRPTADDPHGDSPTSMSCSPLFPPAADASFFRCRRGSRDETREPAEAPARE